MKCYHCNMEIEEVDTCPICKQEQYMEDLFGQRILKTDYLEDLEKGANGLNNSGSGDIVEDREGI